MPAIRRLLASYMPNMFNLDGPSRDSNDDARRGPRKPPSLFHLTSIFSSQGTTITAGSQGQDQDDSWILAGDNEASIPLEDLGSPFKCSFNYSPVGKDSVPFVEERQHNVKDGPPKVSPTI